MHSFFSFQRREEVDAGGGVVEGTGGDGTRCGESGPLPLLPALAPAPAPALPVAALP